ncbi:MAG: class I SAM-dependent methyltransferase [Lachnospiraceae bacterium]
MGKYAKYKEKGFVKVCLRTYKFFTLPLFKGLSCVSRFWAGHYHHMMMFSDWCIDNPENFNHDIDLYYQWGKTGRAHWVERGVYNVLALQCFDEPVLIELCCGEGFNASYFYSKNAKYVYSCDFDKKAIARANRRYKRENIEFAVADIRKDIPEKVKGEYPTNVIWDTAIEHFTPEEIDSIMKYICGLLSHKNGILSGHTIVEREDGQTIEQHEYEFKDKEDLKRFLTPWFKNVKVFETNYDDRHNLYFWASNGTLPFDKEWSKMC